MGGLELTYDSREDRVLLKTGLDINHPDWWLTRRTALALSTQLSTSAHAQFETEKLIERLTQSSGGKEEAHNQNDKQDQNYDQFEMEKTGDAETHISRSNQLINDSDRFPLVVQHQVDIGENSSIKVTLICADGTGTAMELPQSGAIRFKQMLIQLIGKAGW